jgi:hypothetical protein
MAIGGESSFSLKKTQMSNSEIQAQISRARALLEGLRQNLNDAIRRGDKSAEWSMKEEIRRKEQEIRNLGG